MDPRHHTAKASKRERSRTGRRQKRFVGTLAMQNGTMATENQPHLPRAKLRLSGTEIVGCGAFVGCYLAIVAWFKWIDVYHTNFATDGVLILAYNVFRILFAFYLFWIISVPGAALIRAFTNTEGKNRCAVNAADMVPLSFFTGAGIWHGALFAFGYLGLCTVPVALCLTVPAVAVSFFDFVSA